MARGGVKKKEFISGIDLENRSRISRAGNANERIKDTLTVTKKKKKKSILWAHQRTREGKVHMNFKTGHEKLLKLKYN